MSCKVVNAFCVDPFLITMFTNNIDTNVYFNFFKQILSDVDKHEILKYLLISNLYF